MVKAYQCHLVVALLECLLRQTVPALFAIERLGHLKSDVHVPAFNRQVETHVLVLDEVKSDFRETLLLQVRDNALPKQVRRLDDVQHLIVVVPHESELEAIFGRVESDRLRPCGTVEAVNYLALDSSQIDRVIERAYDTVIPVCCER
jgi:hypothetical protein